jgi:hypothetical protein
MWGGTSSVSRRSDIHAVNCIFRLVPSTKPYTVTEAYICRSLESVVLRCMRLRPMALVLITPKRDVRTASGRQQSAQLTLFLPMQQILWFVCWRAACECQGRSSPDTVMHRMRLPAFSVIGRHVGVQSIEAPAITGWLGAPPAGSRSSRHRHFWFIDLITR